MTLFGSDTLKDAIGETRAKWGWFVALGLVLLIFGIIAFGNLFVATVASVFVVGWLMLMAGVVEIVHAFGVKTWGRFFYWLLSGLLYAVAGFFAFYNPLLASAVLTFLLAVALIASGLLRIWVGFNLSHKTVGAGSSRPASSAPLLVWSSPHWRSTACGCSDFSRLST